MDTTITVLDAGGRYGIHPTWKGFAGDISYIMFEPERDEAARLAASYGETRPDIRVENMALGEQAGELEMHVYRHRGQSSHYKPNDANLWFAVARPGEGEIIDTYAAPVVTVDGYAQDHDLQFDFMKIDTEGHELSILKGAEKQLSDHVLGVRAEVYFDQVLHDIPLFSELHDFFMARGFQLLNLGYSGRGQHMNAFAAGDRYGILLDSDAVWVRRLDSLEGLGGAVKCLKYAAFCLKNDASDVAMAALLKGVDTWGYDYSAYAGTVLYKGLDVSIQRLCKGLQDRPGQDPVVLEDAYRKVFARKLKSMHDFYQSEEINPLT
ncbi:MAG: FkbM family methyltransferase [Magnetovibrio sp.]|nr:FkbM family methyltransferase [Magnetovibrio sp.]